MESKTEAILNWTFKHFFYYWGLAVQRQYTQKFVYPTIDSYA